MTKIRKTAKIDGSLVSFMRRDSERSAATMGVASENGSFSVTLLAERSQLVELHAQLGEFLAETDETAPEWKTPSIPVKPTAIPVKPTAIPVSRLVKATESETGDLEYLADVDPVGEGTIETATIVRHRTHIAAVEVDIDFAGGNTKTIYTIKYTDPDGLKNRATGDWSQVRKFAIARMCQLVADGEVGQRGKFAIARAEAKREA